MASSLSEGWRVMSNPIVTEDRKVYIDLVGNRLGIERLHQYYTKPFGQVIWKNDEMKSYLVQSLWYNTTLNLFKATDDKAENQESDIL